MLHKQNALYMYICMCVYMYVCRQTYMNMCVDVHVSHRGGLQQYFYNVHALGVIHQQQSWFGAIC